MEQVIGFLDRFFEAEVAAVVADGLPDIDDYNSKLEAMNRFASPKVKNTFGMIPRSAPEEPDYYERAAEYGPPTKRFLFRIDHYQASDDAAMHRCRNAKRTARAELLLARNRVGFSEFPRPKTSRALFRTDEAVPYERAVTPEYHLTLQLPIRSQTIFGGAP